jgi:hypothetical protein
MAANATSQTFVAGRTTVGSGQTMTLPMIVTDGCGPWQTFVGLGRSG